MPSCQEIRTFLQRHCSLLPRHLQRGLQAIPQSHRRYITSPNPRNIQWSLNVDAALRPCFPQQPRWDYVVCHNNTLYAIEVHPAGKKEDAAEVDKKQRWLEEQVKRIWPSRPRPLIQWYWIPTSNVLKGISARRKASSKGIKIKVTRRLTLP